MRKTLSIISAAALLGTVAATASAASVEPITVDPWKSGNATTECEAATAETGISYDYAWKFNSGEGKDEKAPNMSEAAQFLDSEGNLVHSNTITISNSDGTYFDWSATNSIGAVVVKGGDKANIFKYDPQVKADSSLYSPINNGGNVASVSHVTFCWNEDEATEEFSEETAWAAGDRYTQKGNWATYTTYKPGIVTLFAGQKIEAGTVTFSAIESGEVTITVNLTGGAKFADKLETLKVQSYDVAPSGNPAPGGFAHKLDATGTTAELTVPAAAYYGIHADVLVPVAS